MPGSSQWPLASIEGRAEVQVRTHLGHDPRFDRDVERALEAPRLVEDVDAPKDERLVALPLAHARHLHRVIVVGRRHRRPPAAGSVEGRSGAPPRCGAVVPLASRSTRHPKKQNRFLFEGQAGSAAPGPADGAARFGAPGRAVAACHASPSSTPTSTSGPQGAGAALELARPRRAPPPLRRHRRPQGPPLLRRRLQSRTLPERHQGVHVQAAMAPTTRSPRRAGSRARPTARLPQGIVAHCDLARRRRRRRSSATSPPPT